MKIDVKKGKSKIKIEVKPVDSVFSRGLGLMFRAKNTGTLLFRFDRDVNISLTGFFVFFDFLVLWLDAENKVVDWKVARPFEFKISTAKKFRKIIEIPVNTSNMEIIDFFVGKERFK